MHMWHCQGLALYSLDTLPSAIMPVFPICQYSFQHVCRFATAKYCRMSWLSVLGHAGLVPHPAVIAVAGGGRAWVLLVLLLPVLTDNRAHNEEQICLHSGCQHNYGFFLLCAFSKLVQVKVRAVVLSDPGHRRATIINTK